MSGTPNPAPQQPQTITIGTTLAQWLLGAMAGIFLTLIGFAFWLGSLQTRVAAIQQIEDENNSQDTTLSTLEGARINFETRVLKLENQTPAPPAAPTGSQQPGAEGPPAFVGFDTNLERVVVEGDLRVKSNVWGITESVFDSGRENDVRCPEGQFVVGVRALDTDSGGYCVECISRVRVFCRAL